MAEVSSELIYEVVKKVRDRHAVTDSKVDEVKAEIQAVRGHLLAMQQDIHNVYATLVRHETRLERIERRLELVEPATS